LGFETTLKERNIDNHQLEKQSSSAPKRGLFEKTPILKEIPSERIAMTWPIWLKQRTVKAIVCQCEC
jgi:hypothetical protein